jgi:uncharacterized protein YndB with AHSA1/START domain
MDDTLDPILIQVTIPLPMSMIFSGFVDPQHLKSWLCEEAEVEPRLGGIYRLRFAGEIPFTSNGRITQFSQDVDVGFSWQAPGPFEALMNQPEPKTSVYVRLQESPEGIDVTLEHSGWVSGDAWEEARSWHFHLWDDRLHFFKDYLIKVAYG